MGPCNGIEFMIIIHRANGQQHSTSSARAARMASDFSTISNPLATVPQLQTSGSQLDGVPADLEDSILFAGAALTQSAGVLLRLPQDVIAKTIVIFQRFWLGPEGGSLKEYGARVCPVRMRFLNCGPHTNMQPGHLRSMHVSSHKIVLSSQITS